MTALRQPAAPVTALASPALRREGTSLLTPLTARVEALTITSPETYEDASRVLAEVRSARVKWDAKITPAIDPIKEGLDKLYALRREFDRPLEAMETAVKDEMRRWDRVQLEAQRAQERKVEQLRLEAEQKALAAAHAKTPQMRTRLNRASEDLENRAEAVEFSRVSTLVKASGSRRRVVLKWRVTDFQALVEAVYAPDAGAPPQEILMVDKAVMDRLLKAEPEQVGSWPGIEVYEDIEIGVK